MFAFLALAPLFAPFVQDQVAQEPSEADFYTVDYLTPPAGEVLEVGGMAFLSDGTMLVSTRRGRVWWIDNAMAKDPADARFHIFAEGLQEGLGLNVVDDRIYVVQRGELSELIDLDGDKVCDRVRTVSQGWGMSGNYHEFAFGLPVDADGNFFVGTNVGFWNPEWWHGLSKVPYRGWILKISPEGLVTPYAKGARGPAGMGFDTDGQLYYTDNQGDWLPVCGLFPVEEGAFFGHPASLRWTEAYGFGEQVPATEVEPTEARTDPAVWIPYEWSQSTGNLVADQTGGGFGPFAGQLFVAELTNGLVMRCLLEEVDGQMQGAILPFRHNIGSTFRVAFGPDGTLFGGMTNRGWGGLAPDDGIARLRYTGVVPMEYQTIHLTETGFELTFTKPLDVAPDLASIHVRDYEYNWWWHYGSPMVRNGALSVSEVSLSDDGKRLSITIPELQAGRCVRVAIDGIGLVHNEFDYTINRMPGGERIPVAKQESERVMRGDRIADTGDWIELTNFADHDRWWGNGWNHASAESLALKLSDRRQFVEAPGIDTLISSGSERSDARTFGEFGDIEFKFKFALSEGADSGLYFMGRYELQLNTSATECGGIWNTMPPQEPVFRGPGEWHQMEGRFIAPRFDASGNRIQAARFEDVWMDDVLLFDETTVAGPTGGPDGHDEVARGVLRLQANVGVIAVTEMRVKPLNPSEEAYEPQGTLSLWQAGDPLTQGWRMAGPGKFVLEDGALKATGGMGLLWYAGAEFEDFQLDLEWQATAATNNSGIFVRFPDPGNDPWVAVNGGYELQISDADPPKHNTGSVYSFQGSLDIPTKPIGEWNHYRIRVIGQHYHIEVNGQVVNDFIGDRTLRGYIGLQNHDDGSDVRFRNITVTPLGR